MSPTRKMNLVCQDSGSLWPCRRTACSCAIDGNDTVLYHCKRKKQKSSFPAVLQGRLQSTKTTSFWPSAGTRIPCRQEQPKQFEKDDSSKNCKQKFDEIWLYFRSNLPDEIEVKVQNKFNNMT